MEWNLEYRNILTHGQLVTNEQKNTQWRKDDVYNICCWKNGAK